MPVPLHEDDENADPLFYDLMEYDDKLRIKEKESYYSIFTTDNHLASILLFARSRVSWNL